MTGADRDFLGHPRGLAFLLFTEAWERFSYYGMQSLLALYLVRHLLLPGQADNILFFAAFRQLYAGLDGQPLASAIVGTYFACTYVTPILGGLVADRLIGRHRTVLLGAFTMMAGHFLMAFQASFLLALLLLVMGSGLFKGNLASQLGGLYRAGDPRRDAAFQLYYLGINIGLILAPLVIGTLAEIYGWDVGFACAGVGMAIATIVYMLGRRDLPPDAPVARPDRLGRGGAMRAQDRRALTGLILLIPILAVAILPNNQIFNAYLIWGDEHLDLTWFGLHVPASWLITLDAGLGLASLAGLPILYRCYGRVRREPDDLAKLAIGSLFATAGLSCLWAGSVLAGADARVGLEWAIAFHLFNGIGFSHILPVSLALFTRIAPPAAGGMAIGLYYLIFFLGSALVGWIGGFYAMMPPAQFWLMHVLIAASVSGIFLLLTLRRPGFLMD